MKHKGELRYRPTAVAAVANALALSTFIAVTLSLVAQGVVLPQGRHRMSQGAATATMRSSVASASGVRAAWRVTLCAAR